MGLLKRIAIVAALLAVAGVAPQAQMRGLGRITGVVQDEGGNPLEGVTVKAPYPGGTLDSKSDAAGKWAVVGVGKGEWKVDLQKDGFATQRLKVVLERELDRTQTIKVTMKKS